MTTPLSLEVRPALPTEYAAVGELTASTYVAEGHIAAGSDYVEELRAAERRGVEAELYVALVEGRLAGAVTFASAGSPWAELAVDGEAEFRMLVVAPEYRGRGIGDALVRACIERAHAAGFHRLVLCTMPQMHTAHRIYERLGFRRLPERDWAPAPGVDLMAFGRSL